MTFDHSQLIPVLPKIVLLAGDSLVLIVDLFTPRDKDRMWSYALTIATLLAGIAAVGYTGGPDRQIVFEATYVRDAMSDTLKIALMIIAIPGCLKFVSIRTTIREDGLTSSPPFRVPSFTVTALNKV